MLSTSGMNHDFVSVAGVRIVGDVTMEWVLSKEEEEVSWWCGFGSHPFWSVVVWCLLEAIDPNIFLRVDEMDLLSESPTDKLPERPDPTLSLPFLPWLILSLGRASKHFWYLSLQAASMVCRYLKKSNVNIVWELLMMIISTTVSRL